GLVGVGNERVAGRRHMYEYGTTPEQLAEIAVTTRAHAVRNPDAMRGLEAIGIKNSGEITIDDVLSSRTIADPLHLLECCLVTDGGGAVVIVSADVARDIRKPPVWILGTGEAVGYPGHARDITTSAAAISGPAAFERGGGRPGGMGTAEN